MTCISSGTELTTLFTMRCSELGSSTSKEVSVSFRDGLYLGYSAVTVVLTVGLQFTALLFDEHQYFTFLSSAPAGALLRCLLGAAWSFQPVHCCHLVLWKHSLMHEVQERNRFTLQFPSQSLY